MPERTVEISFLGLLNPLLRRRRLLLGFPLASAVTAVMVGLLFPRYVAESSFYPNSSTDLGSVAALAAQFGVNLSSLSGSDVTDSPDFYLELLQSRGLLSQVVSTTYSFPTDAGGKDTLRGNFIDLYRIAEATPDLTLLKAVDKLSGRISTSKDVASGVITIDVYTKWPQLSTEINRRILDLVNAFNLSKRQSQATAERQFIEGRTLLAKSGLAAAESTLADFLAHNRTYQNSPWLVAEFDRLQRQITMAQSIYEALDQSYEQARIEEVRATPLITVVDDPEGSAERSPKLSQLGILGGFLGGVLAVGFAFLATYMERDRGGSPGEYELFRALRRDFAADIARLRFWRRRTSGAGEGNGGSSGESRRTETRQ